MKLQDDLPWRMGMILSIPMKSCSVGFLLQPAGIGSSSPFEYQASFLNESPHPLLTILRSEADGVIMTLYPYLGIEIGVLGSLTQGALG